MSIRFRPGAIRKESSWAPTSRCGLPNASAIRSHDYSEVLELTSSQGDRTWAVLAHLSGCLWIFAIPFGGTIASAIIYITKRHVSPFVADQTRESQNFQNTVSLAVIAVFVVAAFVVERLAIHRATEPALATIALGAVSLAAIMIANVILSVVAAVSAQRGEAFRYPLCVRLIRAASEPSATR